MGHREFRFSSVLKCGHCSNMAPMPIVAEYSDTSPDEDREEPPFEVGDIYELLKCPACKHVILRSFFWHDLMDPEDGVAYKFLYPTDPRMPLGLPEVVEKAYLAALKVKPIDANAFGVLIGRVIEIVCQDRGAGGETMNEKLKDLSTRGEIPIKLVDVAHRLRGFRNVGAHAELGDLTLGEVPIVDDLCRAILDYIYTAPHLVQSASARLSKLKKS